MTQVKKQTIPFASQSNGIENFIMWLKDETRNVHYGEVGLTFIVHNDQVVRVNQIKNISCKAVKK